MGLDNPPNRRASFNASSEECRKALAEYYRLAKLPELSDKEFWRMQAILAKAESNEVMSLLINEIDEMTFQELGLYDEGQRSHFADEASRVQEQVLDETERKILTPLSIARQTKFVGDNWSNHYHPRVEMVFDASHTNWVQLEKSYFLEERSECSACRSVCAGCARSCHNKCLACRMKKFIYTLFVEESVYLFMVAGLICILFFILV